jgi:hypothetical protein
VIRLIPFAPPLSCPSSKGGEVAVSHLVAVGMLRETLVVGMFPTEHFPDLLGVYQVLLWG